MALPVSSPQLQGFEKNWVNISLKFISTAFCEFAGSSGSWRYNNCYFPVAYISVMVLNQRGVLVRSLFSGDVLADETDKSML